MSMNNAAVEEQFDLGIVGGGIAGLSLAIRMQLAGWRVLVLEQHAYPRHKVCGEYVSAEVVPYLAYLGIKLPEEVYPRIKTLWLTVSSGRGLSSDLEMGGIGISRFAFDSLLAKRATEVGVKIKTETVGGMQGTPPNARLICRSGSHYACTQVVFAHGKHGSPDRFLQRSAIPDKQEYSGLKWHMKADDWPENLVALHNFPGGYVGISKVEDNWVNVCALVQTRLLRSGQRPEEIFKWVMARNPHVAKFMQTATPRWESPMAIGAVHFKPKSLVEGNSYLVGDAAGLIAPLTGNGMARAVRSSTILANTLLSAGKVAASEAIWQEQYASQMKTMQAKLPQARILQHFFGKRMVSESALIIAKAFPFLLKPIIARTHGKAIPAPLS